MNPKIKNAIIFIVIGLVMVSLYFIFIKKDKEEANLVTTTTNTTNNTTSTSPASPRSEMDVELAKDFLGLLLSVKNITLNESIFTDSAYLNLRDSSILLVPDGSEGRPNPFAPLGVDIGLQSASAIDSLKAFSESSNTASTGTTIEGEIKEENLENTKTETTSPAKNLQNKLNP